MSFETNKLNVVKKERLEKSDFVVECNIEANAEINKVFSVAHSAQIENVEVLNGVINYAGTINLTVIFQTADGEIGTVNSACPFVSKFEGENIKIGDLAWIDVVVTDYQINGVSQNNIRISCKCEQSCILIKNTEILTANTSDENVCEKKDETKILAFVGQKQEKIDVESNFSIKEPIKRVIFCESQATTKAVESGVNFVTVSGDVVSKLLYLTQNDRFETGYVTESFREEIELDGVTRESVCQAKVCVLKNLSKCEVEDVEKGVKIHVLTPIDIKVVAFEEKMEEIVEDVYSTENELKITTESFEMTRSFPSETFETKIEGTLTLDDEKPRVDKIMFVGATNLLVTNAYVKDDKVFVEGIAKTNVVYLNDETNALHSVLFEVPFVASEKTDYDCESGNVFADVMIYDVDVVVKKGREFYFDAKLKIETNYDCDEVGAVISGIEIGNEKTEKDCGMEVYFGQQGETSWGIAKNLGIREDVLFEQNPETTFPLEKDENLIVYYQKRT